MHFAGEKVRRATASGAEHVNVTSAKSALARYPLWQHIRCGYDTWREILSVHLCASFFLFMCESTNTRARAAFHKSAKSAAAFRSMATEVFQKPSAGKILGFLCCIAAIARCMMACCLQVTSLEARMLAL